MPIPVFDAHCDTISEVSAKGESLRRNKLHVDLERGGRFSPYAQVFAVFTRPWPDDFDFDKIDYSRDWPEHVLAPLGAKLLDALLRELGVNCDILTLCKSAEDAKKAAEAGRIASFIAIEGAELLGCDLELLEGAYEKGVRLINLCWNYDNALCGAANGPSKGGLTGRGRAYVARMQELGIAVDLSHASEAAFWDAAEIANRPIIAGHSNAKAICDHPRNLTDAQFKELIRLEGVAGINLCPEFLNATGLASIDDIVRHIEHFLALGGEKAICLGGDLDGIDKTPSGIAGIEDYDKIYEALICRNHPEALVRDIFYNNLLNVLEKAL